MVKSINLSSCYQNVQIDIDMTDIGTCPFVEESTVFVCMKDKCILLGRSTKLLSMVRRMGMDAD